MTLTRPTQWVLCPRWASARASQPVKLTFSILRPERLTHPCCECPSPDGCRPGLSTTQLYLSVLLVRLSEPRSPDGRRREHSRPDNLTFSSPTLGEAYTTDTVKSRSPVGCRQEPPSQTNLPFPSARTTISNPRRTLHTRSVKQS